MSAGKGLHMAAAHPAWPQGALDPRNILLDLAREDRASVVRALVRRLAESGRIAPGQAPAMLRLVAERESLGSTALGGGLALPHARAGLAAPAVAAAILKGSVEGWAPLDDAPVRAVFLLLTPKADDACHRGLIGALLPIGRSQPRLRALAGCRTPEDLLQALEGN